VVEASVFQIGSRGTPEPIFVGLDDKNKDSSPVDVSAGKNFNLFLTGLRKIS
jgi:hypothetical protein